ncbi:MAG: B12-binding domain-containing radical SAM protein [Patescibacteria group bacterium]
MRGKTNTKVVLVYPKYPDTFWSFKHALKFISKKASHPPLGLLTVAAMLPKEWEKKLIDMKVSKLKDKDLMGADLVFISAMSIQKASAKEVIRKCQKMGIKVVAGGPLFTTEYQDFSYVDHLILNEAEITLPPFLEDLKNGCPQRIYGSKEYPDLGLTPVPLWELIKMRKYLSMNLQYSRGCPFNCEFCNITALFGRGVRTKSKDQMITELNSLYSRGWRGGIFMVDDNFIGNKPKLKKDVLPAMIDWMTKRKNPFVLTTEASINLADDEELMRLMARARFNRVFVGIETPNEASLAECGKIQNRNRDLIASVQKIQQFGLQVTGGFIVGFDNDDSSIFQRQIDFIQKSGIVTAMVGLLNAPRGTRLYQRLTKEGRILKDMTGDNTDFSTNFVTKIKYENLVQGYKKIISGIYSPKPYYKRVKRFLKEKNKLPERSSHFHFRYIRLHYGFSGAIFKSIWFLGIKDRSRGGFWKLFFWSLFRHPQLFSSVIGFAIYGFHFRKVFGIL